MPTPIISVTGATGTQDSPEIRRPAGSKSIIVTVDVTAGTSLLLVCRLRGTNASGDQFLWTLPPAESLTGVGKAHYLFTEDAAADVGAGITETFLVPILDSCSVRITHSNANAATYTVYADFQ